MEWTELILSFIEKQTGHLVTLGIGYAWPVVAALLFYTQRGAITKLIEAISEISLKIGSSEAKIGTRKIEALTHTVDVAEQVVTETVPDGPPQLGPQHPPQKRMESDAQAGPKEDQGLLIEPPIGENLVLQARKRLRFRDAAYSAPPVVIERAWREVRNSVYKLLGIDKSSETWWDLDGLPDEQLIAKLKADPRVDAALLRAIVELKMIRNDATTTIGWQPTTTESRQYQENAKRVIELIAIAAAGSRT